MRLRYRTDKNAQAVAAFWEKPLGQTECYKINSLSDDNVELFLLDVLGWPFNDINMIIKDLASIKADTITVRINSPGGDVLDSVALYQALKNHSSRVITRIESLAASAASIVAMSGREVQAYSTSLLMIHNSWVIAMGDRFELQEISNILEKIDGTLLDVYIAKTKAGKREMSQMMKDETWFTAKEMKEKGFIDTIVDGKGAKASFDLSIFANVPDELISDDHADSTIRNKERALRDVGFSQKEAKAILAGRKDSTQRDVEGIQAITNRVKRNLTGG
ncbi:MAG: Clp protease ClpP [Spirochaetales bacterium]|jgi:ATP-dependent Clp protease protease subunit|nr:Clp protease ClpP [Spirochaetales bacterium]